jgi:diphosphomevalonate decarboxylase
VSGSGCRSLFGGFVEWLPGDSRSSIARQIVAEDHWPDLRVLSIALSAAPKLVPSTAGMKQTADAVPWFRWRAQNVVTGRIAAAIDLARARKFSELGEIIMRESNELHANCAAAWPPIHYLSDQSRFAVDAVHRVNSKSGKVVAAYSFDAGPNPFIFVLQDNLEVVKQHMLDELHIPETLIRLAQPARGIDCKLFD